MTTRKAFAPAVAGVLAILAFAACSGPQSGYVTAKEHESSYVFTTMTYCGKGCLVPVTNTRPECYRLDLRTADGDTRSVCVGSDVYEQTQVGDFFEERP